MSHVASNLGKRAFMLLAAILSAAVLARLGVWQLDRAAQKQALQAALEERGNLPVLANAGLNAGQHEDQLHRKALLRGHWQPGATVYLDNRPMDGRAGFIVITPLVLQGRLDAIAVQRGWLARDEADRTRLPVVPTSEELVEVSGRLAPAPSRLLEFQPENSSERIRQNLDLDGYAVQAGQSLLPMTLLQDEAGVLADGLLRHWPSPVANVQKHHAYALQWFALSALVVILYIWFQLMRPARVPD